MYSAKNYVTVEEELLVLLVYQEYHSPVEDDEKVADEE